MFALAAILLVVAVLCGVVRRAGMAGSLALVGAFVTAFGTGPPQGADWTGAAGVAIVVFVCVRFAQRQARRGLIRLIGERDAAASP